MKRLQTVVSNVVLSRSFISANHNVLEKSKAESILFYFNASYVPTKFQCHFLTKAMNFVTVIQNKGIVLSIDLKIKIYVILLNNNQLYKSVLGYF